MKTHIKFAGLAVVGVLTLAGCFHNGGANVNPNDGGLYRSGDGGQTWEQKVDVLATQGRVLRFQNADVSAFEQDPQHPGVLYAGTNQNGIFYSTDRGESWLQINAINQPVLDIAVSFHDTCRYVVATPKKIWRTVDCGRSFMDVLTEQREDSTYRFVITDHFNPNFLYAVATNDVLKSTDFGNSWQTVGRFNREIQAAVMDRKDSRVLYVGLRGEGIRKSSDGGQSWQEITEPLDEYRDGKNVLHIVQDTVNSDTYYVATTYGLLKTTDGGSTFSAINLLTQPGAVVIHALDVDPRNGSIVYYGTESTYYKTVDGGSTWQAEDLPTSRAASVLHVDNEDSNTIYLGTKVIKK